MDERILKIVERWYLTEPALFQIYCTHNLEQNTTISVPFRCGKGKIEYNPNLICDLSYDILESYLKAEIIRILLKHPYERQPDGCKHKATSMGSNMVLSDNYDFTKINLPNPSEFGLNPSESFEWYSFRMEEYYSNQPSEIQSEKKSQNIPLDNNRIQNFKKANNDNTIEIQLPDGTKMLISSIGAKVSKQSDLENNNSAKIDNPQNDKPLENRNLNHTTEMEDLSALWEEDSVMQCSIDVTIDEIEAVNGWGSLSGKISQVIIANTKAKIDYRKILAGFRASILSSKRQLTRMRPNRRSGFDNMGSIRRFDTNLLVAVDVSGSITNHTLMHFFSIINKAFKYGINHIDVIQFDTELKEKVSFEKAKKNISVLGRGGTSFQPIFDYIGSHLEYDGLIIFTDGQAPEPIPPKHMRCKVFWVLNDQRNYESNKKWMKKTGRSCIMKL